MISNAYILLSGGIDSTAALDFFIRNNYATQCVFVNYKQLSSKNELHAVERIATHYKVPLKVIEIGNLPSSADGFILGRNLFLVSIALMSFPFKSGSLVMGIHSDTTYPDCTPGFVNKTQEMLNLYSKGAINIRNPFITWKKLDIWQYCIDNKVPTGLTYSCELGKVQPCGICLSCKDIQKINAFEGK